jgi:hypothetical protein
VSFVYGHLKGECGAAYCRSVVPRIVRRGLALSAILALALGAATAIAGPGAVIDDYRADGRIDGAYSVADLQGALALMKEQAQYGAFRDVVGDALVSAAAGLRSGERGAKAEVRSAPPPPAAAQPSGGQQSQERASSDPGAERTQAELPAGLPSSPPADPESGLPVGFVVLSGLAGLLLVSGIGSTVYRRLRR